MATSYNLITNVVIPSSIQLYPTNAPTDDNINQPYFGTTSYLDSLLPTQQQIPYTQRATYEDKLTIMVHTQANTIGTALPFPEFLVYDSAGGVVGSLVYPAFIKGAQQVAGNTIEVDGVDIQLNTYCWEFRFGQFLESALGESGIYYLVLRNYATDGVTYLEHKSEPILVYDSHPGTILLQGKNTVNRSSQNIIVNGWDDPTYRPDFWLRCEGRWEKYEPKGIYAGYLQQEYEGKQLRAQNFRTFTLNVGDVSHGVPDYIYEKASEIVLMDDVRLNDTSIIYDIEGSDNNIKKPWQFTDRKLNGLGWGTFPIRQKKNSQNATVVTLPIPDVLLWWSPWRDPDVSNPSPGLFMQYAIPSFGLLKFGGVVLFPTSAEAYVMYSEADEDAVITNMNSWGATNGFTGLFFRDDVGGSPTRGQIRYQQGVGESIILPTAIPVLYKWYGIAFDVTSLSNSINIPFIGYGSIQVFDWQDGSAYNAYRPTDSLPYFASHVFASTGSILSVVFHNNSMNRMIISDGTNIHLIDIPQGNQQENLKGFNIQVAANYSTAPSFPALAACAASLTSLSINGTDITSFPDLFTYSYEHVNFMDVSGNNLPSAEVDAALIGFVANSMTAITAGTGIFKITQTPAAPPTGASAAAIATLTGNGWTVIHD